VPLSIQISTKSCAWQKKENMMVRLSMRNRRRSMASSWYRLIGYTRWSTLAQAIIHWSGCSRSR